MASGDDALRSLTCIPDDMLAVVLHAQDLNLAPSWITLKSSGVQDSRYEARREQLHMETQKSSLMHKIPC